MSGPISSDFVRSLLLFLPFLSLAPAAALQLQRYQIVAPADKQEATRKLEASQQQERELLKSQAIEFGQGSGIAARKAGQTGEAGISLEALAVLPN